jgi:hypothetical protein
MRSPKKLISAHAGLRAASTGLHASPIKRAASIPSGITAGTVQLHGGAALDSPEAIFVGLAVHCGTCGSTAGVVSHELGAVDRPNTGQNQPTASLAAPMLLRPFKVTVQTLKLYVRIGTWNRLCTACVSVCRCRWALCFFVFRSLLWCSCFIYECV